MSIHIISRNDKTGMAQVVEHTTDPKDTSKKFSRTHHVRINKRILNGAVVEKFIKVLKFKLGDDVLVTEYEIK